MKVLLHSDIDRLGYLGDVVEVADGYARNYLLPQGLAILPSEENLRIIQKEKVAQAQKRQLALEKRQKVANEVNGAEIVIEALVNEQGHLFGSVGQSDIAESLQKKGFEVQAKHVKMPEHFHALGDYEVDLHFGQDADAKVQVKVVRPTDVEDGNQSESKSSNQPNEES